MSYQLNFQTSLQIILISNPFNKSIYPRRLVTLCIFLIIPELGLIPFNIKCYFMYTGTLYIQSTPLNSTSVKLGPLVNRVTCPRTEP